MKKLLFFFLPLFFTGILFAQSTSETAMDTVSIIEKKDKLSLNGFVRGSVFGGGETWQLASAFAEMALQAEFKSGKAFLNRIFD